jgi:hypothetical protein
MEPGHECRLCGVFDRSILGTDERRRSVAVQCSYPISFNLLVVVSPRCLVRGQWAVEPRADVAIPGWGTPLGLRSRNA